MVEGRDGVVNCVGHDGCSRKKLRTFVNPPAFNRVEEIQIQVFISMSVQSGCTMVLDLSLSMR